MEINDFFAIAPGNLTAPVLTIGVFDGVHRGHQQLIARLRDQAKEISGQSVVVTFPRHPLTILTGNGPPLIMPQEKRYCLFQKAGVDVCLPLNFDKQVATISAADFIVQHLVRRLGMKSIICGENFRFGHQGQGDCSLLKKYADQGGYQLTTLKISDFAGSNISSTNIRNAVRKGKLMTAENMLGRPFSLIGKVVPGKQRGRTLGFPTANVELDHDLFPPEGVYCGYSQVDGKIYPALTSIGTCPTFDEHRQLKIEVYLVGFDGDLYGQRLETFLWQKIRDQETYSSREELCQQIEKDRHYLLAHFDKWQRQRAVSTADAPSKKNSVTKIAQDLADRRA